MSAISGIDVGSLRSKFNFSGVAHDLAPLCVSADRLAALASDVDKARNGPEIRPTRSARPARPALEALLRGKAQGDASDAQAARFVARSTAEVRRLEAVMRTHERKIMRKLLDTAESLPEEGGSLGRRRSLAVSQFLDAIGRRILDLDGFAAANAAALGSLMHAYDTAVAPTRASTDAAHYIARVKGAISTDDDINPLLVVLSDIYAHVRSLDIEATPEGSPLNSPRTSVTSSTWVPPTEFKRKTTKYWVHPDRVLQFKLAVMRHLPILIFGARPVLCFGRPNTLPQSELHSELSNAVTRGAAITSVYFDNDNLDIYTDRLMRNDGARLVRFRWYGDRRPDDDDKEIFVERKLHRENWTGEMSVKEREAIKQSDVPTFLKRGTVPSAGATTPRTADFLTEVSTFLRDARQHPVLRTLYYRTAFQESSNNVVRISMDEHVDMIRETEPMRGDWCRDTSVRLEDAEVVSFPYAIAEIKLQTDSENAPTWIKDLQESGILVKANKFSKFMHARALLAPPGTVKQYPHWFVPDAKRKGTLRPATIEEMARSSESEAPAGANLADFLFRRSKQERSPSPSGTAASADRAASRQPMAPALQASSRGTRSRGSTATDTPFDSYNGAQQTDFARSGSPSRGSTQPGEQVIVPVLRVSQARRSREGRSPSPPASARRKSPSPAPAPGSRGGSPDNAASFHFSSPQAGGQPTAALGGWDSTHPRSQQQAAGWKRFVPGLLWTRAPSTPTPTDRASEEGPDGEVQLSKGQLPVSIKRKSKGRTVGRWFRRGRRSNEDEPQAVVRTRADPKTFFANERTFLSWLSISVLLMLTALSLLNSTAGGGSAVTGDTGGSGSSGGCDGSTASCRASQIAGAIIAPVGVLFIIYALVLYRARSASILQRKNMRYDDQYGPAVLMFILALVMAIAYAVAMYGAFGG